MKYHSFIFIFLAFPFCGCQQELTFTGPAKSRDLNGVACYGQYVCAVPFQNLVLVRMGENPDQSLIPIQFLNDIWRIIEEK